MRRRARPARPPPALLHRQGRRRQEHRHRGDRAARGRAGQAGPRSSRSTPRATSPRCSSTPPVGFEPRQVHPGVFAMQMDTEASLREYLKVQPAGPGVRAARPARARVRLRRHRRAGREGDPHRRQGVLGGARVDRGPRRLGSHRGRRRRDRSRRSASSTRPRAIRELVQVGPGPQPDRVDGRAALRSRAHRAQRRHRRRRRCRSTRRSSWSRARARSSTCRSASSIVNRVLPELFTHADEAVFDALREPGRRRACSTARGRAGCDRGARRRPPRGVAAPDPRRCTSRELRDAVDLPLLLPAVPVRPRPRPAGDAHGRRGARPGARAVTAPTPACARARVAARDARDRRVLRLGRRGQDLGRGRGRARRGDPPRRQGARAHHRPGAAARRRARARGVRQRRAPVSLDELLRAAGVEPRGELYAAMLDTKRSWDELVLRHAPDEETAYRILDNRLYHNVTGRFVQSHDYIAMERLYDLHASGAYDLIVIDTPPTRNAIDFLDAPARMADFFGGRLLRWLTMPYRIGGGRGARMVNVASRPFYQMADRILGSQFLQDIAEFFLNFQSMYGGLRRARPGRRAAAARPAHDVRGRHHARGRAAARGRVLLRRAHRRATSTSARWCSTRRCPSTSCRADGERAADVLERDARRDRASELAATGVRRRSPTRRARPACCARSPTSFRNFEVVATPRGRAARPSSARAPRGRRRRARASRPTSPTSPVSRASASYLFAVRRAVAGHPSLA